MIRGAEQEAGSGTILAPGDRVLVVTAGRGDRGDVAVRMLEHLGASCVLLDVSSAGSDPDRLRTVQDAYRQLSGSRGMALAGVGLGAGPVLSAAAALAEHAPPPCVLIVNGRFNAAARPFEALRVPSLLLLDRDCPRRERAAHRAVARELGESSRLVVVRALAEDGDEALSSWRSSTPAAVVAAPEVSTPTAVVAAPEVSMPEPVPAPPRLRAVETPRSRTRAA